MLVHRLSLQRSQCQKMEKALENEYLCNSFGQEGLSGSKECEVCPGCVCINEIAVLWVWHGMISLCCTDSWAVGLTSMDLTLGNICY